MIGKEIRLERIINRDTGKAVIVPLDHGVSSGPILGITNMKEAMSQVAAMAAGYAEEVSGRPAGLGLLAAIGNFSVIGTARIGDSLVIQVEIVKRFGRLVRAEGRVSVNDVVLATAELTLTVPESEGKTIV